MAPLTDDGVYKFTCRLGHENAVAWQAFKFEYLFEMAIHAIADGYNREAVASATASLERFYEFFYRAVSRKDGVPDEEVDRVWKRMRKQSERQLGTFMSLHLSRFKMAPDLLAENHKESKWEPSVQFRNSVTHEGAVPTRDQAIAYCNRILNLIIPTLNALKRDMPETLTELLIEHVQKLGGISGTSMTMSNGTTLATITPEDAHPSSIVERLRYVEEQRTAGLPVW